MVSKQQLLNYATNRKVLIAVSTIILLLLISQLFGSSTDVKFKTAEIKKGELSISVSATGTVEPEEVIDVGAQVAGQIIKFGTDIEGKVIDYGSVVEAGAMLAQIDESLYQTEVNSTEAQLKRANADLVQAQAKQKLAEQEWNRAKELGVSEALSKSSYQTYKANYDVAVSNVAVAEAAIVQADATLSKAKRNLAFTTINSPVKGVIIDRRVNIGQTVVSSLNAPSLFLLAKDLKKMQVWIAVNEADIGNITPGQAVSFTVDTFPNQTFKGTVKKIRLNASMNQNVVTYVVEVHTDNSDGKLLPYLTANAQFEISNHKDILLVPNSALRWMPDAKLISSKYSEEYGNGNYLSKLKTGEKILWLPDGDLVKPIVVKVIGSDGISSEIQGPDLQDGQQIVLSEQVKEEAASTAKSPFAPQMPNRRRN